MRSVKTSSFTERVYELMYVSNYNPWWCRDAIDRVRSSRHAPGEDAINRVPTHHPFFSLKDINALITALDRSQHF